MAGRTLIAAVVASLAGLVVAAPTALAAPALSGEFPVSDLDTNNKIVAGPDGSMWLTLAGANDVAKISPAEQVEEFDLGVESASGIAPDAEGRLWVTHTNGITSFLPNNPVGTKATTAIAAIAGSHAVVLGPDGNLWVATNDNLVRVPPTNPAGFKAFPVLGLGPRDIDVAGGLLAIADFGGQRVLTATPTDPPVTVEYKASGGLQGVAGGPGGQISYTQPLTDPREFGLVAPPGPPVFTVVPGADLFGVAFGADGAYWSPDFVTGNLYRLTTANQLTILPAFAAAAGPRQIAAGPGNTLWVTLQLAKKVGRVSGVEPPAPVTPNGTPGRVEPRTRIDRGPKGKVRTKRRRAAVAFRFSSPDAGAGFECRLLRLRARPGKRPASSAAVKSPPFRPCRYRLRPGAYRFEVRSVLSGTTDATPAARRFQVVRVAR